MRQPNRETERLIVCFSFLDTFLLVIGDREEKVVGGI